MWRCTRPDVLHFPTAVNLEPIQAGRDVIASGWPHWLRADIERWIDESPLPACPYCGVKLKRLDMHFPGKHPDTPRGNEVVDAWPLWSGGATSARAGGPVDGAAAGHPSWLSAAAAASELGWVSWWCAT